ncbi:sulfatase-like hydrolase/transferase [Jiangella asiatica]|uniref:Sulfatase N-terminal domain-containing protein n=1 Tax=Jiangella asiatica TaxID=2530372 RepID=A0A4R5DTU4_9ACTN|nr:sulfatase-like hydrolase/transferase [Jiangella asiatica]TDE14313.1 hypothetical protein E1269_03925 [Jiangella asiatica]
MPEHAPNVVILLNDHQAHYRHGWDDGPRVRRPQFDRLRGAGVTFERAYCQSPLCSPARRSIVSGRYPHSHGEIRNDTGTPFDEPTLFSELAAAGYAQYYFGKWHAGPGTAQDLGAEGFSYPSYNNPYTKPEYATYLASRGLPEPTIQVERSFHPPDWGEPLEGLYRQTGGWCNEHAIGVLQSPDDTHEAYFLANLACEQLDRLAAEDSERPFSMVVSFWGPHAPYFPTQRFLDMYPPGDIPPYGSVHDDLAGRTEVHWREGNHPMGAGDRLVQPSALSWQEWQRVLAHCYAQNTLVDDAAGRILDRLDALSLTDHTLVVWLADHGDAIASHGGHFDKRSYLTEEVLRIPFALRWPGGVAAGQTVRDRVGQIDILPTVLDAAGAPPPAGIDGASLLPLVRGEQGWRDEIVCETHGHGEKIVGRALIGSRYKYVAYDGIGEELYDLVTDPYELHNLTGSPEHHGRLAASRERLRDWRAATGDPTTPDGALSDTGRGTGA